MTESVKYIQPHSFVKVVGDALVPDGLKEKALIYVADLKALPIDKDPYTQRIHILGHKVLNQRKGEIDITEILLVDPSNVSIIPDGKNKKLLRNLEKFFNEHSQETTQEPTTVN